MTDLEESFNFFKKLNEQPVVIRLLPPLKNQSPFVQVHRLQPHKSGVTSNCPICDFYKEEPISEPSNKYRSIDAQWGD